MSMRRKFVWGLAPLLLALLAVAGAGAQITIPNTFVNHTVADADEVNANFTAVGSGALNRNGGTMLGTLTAQNIAATADATYDVGASGVKFRDFFFSRNGTVGGTLAVTGAATFSSTTSLNSLVYTWPASQTASYFLQTNGSGGLSWALAGSPTVTATKTVNYTAAINELVVCNGTFTVTLPASASNSGKTIDVKNIGTGTVTVDGNASETIDGATTYDVTVQYQNVTLVSDGTNWYIR